MIALNIPQSRSARIFDCVLMCSRIIKIPKKIITHSIKCDIFLNDYKVFTANVNIC